MVESAGTERRPSGRGLRSDVSLAPLRSEHADAMLRWMRDPEISRNIGLRTEPTIEKTRAWIERALSDEAYCPFAILHGGAHVGNVILDRMDRYLATARLSIYVGEPASRKAGVGYSAVCLAVEEAFGRLDLRKVWLTVHALNAGAVRLYGRVGFSVEGVLREEFLLDGRRLDVLYMGLLRKDWGRS